MASLFEFGANSRSPATAVIPVLRRLVQGHEEFQASLGHKVSLCLNHLPPAHTKKRNHKITNFFLQRMKTAAAADPAKGFHHL